MYALVLWGNEPSGTPQTTLITGEFNLKGWSDRINAPGDMLFSLPKRSPLATTDNLREWRKVDLHRRVLDGSGMMVPVWSGVIEAVQEVGTEIEVLCAGGLRILEKRPTPDDAELDGMGSAEVFALLTGTNDSMTGYGPTGITSGTGGVTTTRDLIINGKTILAVLEDLARAHDDAEYRVNPSWGLDFVPALGSDKSGQIHLFFEEGATGNNVKDVERGSDGRKMANVVIGRSSAGGGLASTQESVESQTLYGIKLVEEKQFNEAQDQETLDAMTLSYVNQIAFPLTNLRLMPVVEARRFNVRTGEMEMSGLAYGDVEVGDLVMTTIKKRNFDETEARRVAEISVNVDENLKETLSFTLSKAGVFVTSGYLENSLLTDLTERIKQLEKNA